MAERDIFECVLECLPDSVVIADGEGRITHVNAQTERMFGYSRDELRGKPLELLVPDALALVPMESAAEMSGRAKDGRSFPVEIRLSAGPAAGGNFVIGVIRDITARKQTEQALRESEQRYQDIAHELEQQLLASDRLISFGELAASIAHELNHPLELILGFAQELLAEMDASHPHYDAVKIIERETGRCAKIVRDLLDFARPAKPEPKPLDLVDLLRKSLYLVLPELRRAKVETEIDLDPNLPPVYGDSQQLEQVLLNLFFNAIEAMPQGGTLTVRAASKPPEEVMIAVADTGVGIPSDDIPKIFLPFFTTKARRGMGLGLSICQRIIRAHGGRIEVESRPGQGTSFYLYLPCKP
jgi:PAS domain S-box-containing protein